MGGCLHRQSTTEKSLKGLKVNMGDFSTKDPKNTADMLTFKVVLLGDSAVGKTSISIRYLKNEFNESHIVTIGAQFQQPII